MRARIDISEIEAETKIRAKYLRALENEEWDLLPGPTFVKSFLRTYADALGLDSRLLLEEYKLRHERLSDIELQPIAPPGQRDTGRRSRRRSGGLIPRAYVIWGVVLALLAAIYIIGSSGDDGDKGETTSSTPADTTATTPAKKAKKKAKQTPAVSSAKVVRLQIVPTGSVYVCLQAKGNRTLIDGATLSAGAPSKTFRSSRFVVTLGNNAAQLRIKGKLRDVPEASDGIGYVITRKGRRTLSAADRPTCS